MTDPLVEITRGLTFEPFQDLRDYVEEHIPYRDTNLYRAGKDWPYIDPEQIEYMRMIHCDDATFEDFLAFARRQSLEEMETLAIAGIKDWGERGLFFGFGRSVATGCYELLPFSLWAFADLDIEALVLSRDGASVYRDLRFILEMKVPEEHPLRETVRRLNSPEVRPTDAESAALAAESLGAGRPPLKTGAPGRPSSMHHVMHEFERRVAANQLEESLARQAEALADWLKQTLPKAPSLKPKSIMNKLRDPYQKARAASVKPLEKGPKLSTLR